MTQASFSSSIARFPSGTVLDVVDDGPADSMAEAQLWASVMMGEESLSAACAAGGSTKKARRMLTSLLPTCLSEYLIFGTAR